MRSQRRASACRRHERRAVSALAIDRWMHSRPRVIARKCRTFVSISAPIHVTGMAKAKTKQRVISFGPGGWRPGAGRPRSTRRNKRVLHRKRPRITRHTPAHITMKLIPELSSLRTKKRAKVIRDALIACCANDRFRIVDWSIQSSHLHLIIEADDNAVLARGMQAFSIRVARGLNRVAGRNGTVFTERYHIHVLGTPS